jgi:tetratricopeptide (TPR) repeat protein
MPDAHRLVVLTELRRAARVTLEQMARDCGLTGRKGRESVSAWERGQSVPHTRSRTKFIDYLGNTLGLRTNAAQFYAVWNVLVDQWDWDPVSEAEWHQHFGVADTEPRADTTGAQLTPHILKAHAVLARMPMNATTLPPLAPLPPGSRMPFGHNPFFVGRTEELQALAATLNAGGIVTNGGAEVAAICGLGGLGKTQLATEFVHRYGQFFAGGVFWLSFADPRAAPAEIASCGGSRHLALRPDFDLLPIDEQLRLVQEAWSDALPRLFIFDNCEDPELLERWLPTGDGCRVLVTSRRSEWPARLGVRSLLLGVLSRNQSIGLLRKHLPDRLTSDAELISIAAELGDLPLALHLAGHFLARYRAEVTPADYLQQLRGPDILQHPSLQAGGISPTGYVQHVARTFALSYDRLDPSRDIDRMALDLLARAACFAPGEPIQRDLLLSTAAQVALGAETRLASDRRASDALGLLIEQGLLVVGAGGLDGADATVRMHRLLVAFVRQVMPDDAALLVEHVLLATARQLNEVDAHMQMLELQPHLRAVADTAEARADEQAADLCFELSQHLLQIEDYEGAQRYNQHSLDIRRTRLGARHLKIADNLHQLGWMLDCQGQSAEAQAYHQQALAIRQARLGDNHPDTAESFNYMGTVLHAQSDYSKARRYYERALAIRQLNLGEHHAATAQSLNNLGLLLHAMGYYAEARPYLEQALAIRERAPKPNYSKLTIVLNNLGYLLRAMGRYAEAQRHLERALAIRKEVFGPDNTYIAVTLNHLGRLHHYLGNYEQAQRCLEQALAIRQQVIGLYHPDTANSLGNWGMLLYDLGQLDEARPYLEKALAIHQQVWGSNHRHTARSLNHLGMLWQAHGERKLARHYYEQSLEIRKRVLTQSHPDTGNSLGNLGALLLTFGSPIPAQTPLATALAIHQQSCGNDHPYTARSLERMGRMLLKQGHVAAAQRHLRQSLKIYERTLGAAHPFTRSCRAHLQPPAR